MLEGANQINSDFEELVGKYDDHEKALKQQIKDAEQSLSIIKEHDKKKEDVAESLRLVKEKLSKILFPMDPQDWNINTFNNHTKAIEKIVSQSAYKEKLTEFDTFCQAIPRLQEKEKAVVNDALTALDDLTSSITHDVEERQSGLQKSIGYLRSYSSQHDEVTDWLHNQEEILSSFHYQSTLEKKMEQKEAFTTVLQTSENWKQASLNRYLIL